MFLLKEVSLIQQVNHVEDVLDKLTARFPNSAIIRPVASPGERGGGGKGGYMLKFSITVYTYCTARTSSHLLFLHPKFIFPTH